MIVVYFLIASVIEILYVNIAHKSIDFWTNYLILKRGGVRVPVSALIIYLTMAGCLFTIFHILVIVFAFVVLE